MVDFQDASKSVQRYENVVGWYHSHPGYGCWLSGIDCSTQMLNQQYQVRGDQRSETRGCSGA